MHLGLGATRRSPQGYFRKAERINPFGGPLSTSQTNQVHHLLLKQNSQPKAGGFLFGVSQSIGSTPVRPNANAFGTRSNATQPAGLFPQSGKNQSLRGPSQNLPSQLGAPPFIKTKPSAKGWGFLGLSLAIRNSSLTLLRAFSYFAYSLYNRAKFEPLKSKL
jgi:hypothetical protein